MKRILLFFSLALSLGANAGVISGGGGKAVVCRDSAGAIISAQTLDLFEGDVLYRLNIVSSNDSVATQVQRALAVIPKDSGILIGFYVQSVQRGLNIQHGVDLTPVDDASQVAVPHGCKPEQLANYFDDSNILVDGDIWDKLSPTNQAALILHEAVYREERNLGATNSLRSRHVVASLFAPSTAWVDVLDGLPRQTLTCLVMGPGTGASALFYAYQDHNQNWNLQFATLGGNTVMSKKTFSLAPDSGNGPFDFTEAKTFPVEHGEDKIGTEYASGGLVSSIFENGDIVVLKRKWEAITDARGNTIPGYQTPPAVRIDVAPKI